MRYPSTSPGRITGPGPSGGSSADDDSFSPSPPGPDPAPAPSEEFGSELGGDPVNTPDPSPQPDPVDVGGSADGPADPTPDQGGGTSRNQQDGPLDNLVEDTLNPAADQFRDQVVEPAGDVARAISPAAQVSDRLGTGA